MYETQILGEFDNDIAPENLERFEKISEIFKELKNSSKELAKAKIAYARAKGRETVSKSVKTFKDSIYTAGKNFGLKLEENANKYQETRTNIDSIIAEYELSLNTLRGAYNNVSEANQLKLEELLGKKDEILAEISIVEENKQQYIEENFPELYNNLESIRTERNEMQKKAINAIKNGNIEEAGKFLDKCEELKQQSQNMESEYGAGLDPFDNDLKKLDDEYRLSKYQIEEAEKIASKLEDEFQKDCDESLDQKKELLAKVENNKMFDKIKGFLSRSVLKKINSVQKFNKEYLEPTKENVKKFAKSVPERAANLNDKFKDALSNILGKGKQIIDNAKDLARDVKDKTIDTARNARDFASSKVQDMSDGISQANDFITGKASQAKDFVVNKARDARDVVDSKIQDVGEGLRTAKDYVSGKTYQAIDEAYEIGKRARSATRNCAIDKLESAAAKFNEKAQELKNKENEINNRANNKDTQQQGLF